MMARFRLTKKALADLKEIAQYTQKEWGTEQRNTYLSMLDTFFHLLATNPLRGRDCSEIRAGYRKQVAGSHVVFYRQLSPDEIEIVRVLHASMDLEEHLSER